MTTATLAEQISKAPWEEMVEEYLSLGLTRSEIAGDLADNIMCQGYVTGFSYEEVTAALRERL